MIDSDNKIKEAVININILEEMLKIDENERISTLRLALLLNYQDLLINNKLRDPFLGINKEKVLL